MGAGVECFEFVASGIGSVHGIRLRDGRRVVVKVRDADVEQLRAIQQVQARLAESGFPAPRPLLGPTPLADGIATAEALLDDGERGNAREPAVRRAIAATLARLIDLCRAETGLRELGPTLLTLPLEGGVWPTPHDRRFDFDATASGAEWIDRLAMEARRQRDSDPAGELVVGHSDWRVEHLRFARGEVTAVYDWDSLALDRVPVFVGSAAHAFLCDWSADGVVYVPLLDEALAFVDDYESARGRAFTERERRVAIAALLHATAYGARCEHSDALTAGGTRPPAAGPPPAIPPGTFRELLARHGSELLGVHRRDVPPLG